MSYEVLKILNKYKGVDDVTKYTMGSDIVKSYQERDESILEKVDYLLDLTEVMDMTYVHNYLLSIKKDINKWQK